MFTAYKSFVAYQRSYSTWWILTGYFSMQILRLLCSTAIIIMWFGINCTANGIIRSYVYTGYVIKCKIALTCKLRDTTRKALRLTLEFCHRATFTCKSLLEVILVCFGHVYVCVVVMCLYTLASSGILLTVTRGNSLVVYTYHYSSTRFTGCLPNIFSSQ